MQLPERVVTEGAELDLPIDDSGPYPRISQDLELSRPLATVGGIPIVAQTRVAGQLRDAEWQPGEDPGQSIYAYRSVERRTRRRLPVEVPTVAHPRTAMSQRNRELTRQPDHDRTSRLAPVDVLVRIQVGGIPTDEAAEGGQLASRLLLYRRSVLSGDHLVHWRPGPQGVEKGLESRKVAECLFKTRFQVDLRFPVQQAGGFRGVHRTASLLARFCRTVSRRERAP
jgi:hypothetical protein